MALPIAFALRSAGRFALRNPGTLLGMARHAIGMKIAVPLDAVRWFIDNQVPGKSKPTDVTVIASPPGITVGASLDLMKTPVRASATVYVDELHIGENQLQATIRLADVDLTLLADVESQVATLLKSGALDLSKPGDLVRFMPQKPPVIVDAGRDKITLDLLRDSKIANNPKVKRFLTTVAPVLTVRGVHTDGDFIVLNLKATPSGVRRAIKAVRSLPA